jgi:hypothetical protein
MKLITDELVRRITPRSDFLLRLEARQAVEAAFAELEAEKAARERAEENARLLGQVALQAYPQNVTPMRKGP